MKKIAISMRVDIFDVINERRDALSQEWSELSLKIGFIPIYLPNNMILCKNILNEVNVDGIILSGGNNLYNYSGNAFERDETEKFLIDYCIEKSIPILGICRGMQIILDYFKNSLEKVENHVKVEHLLDDGDIIKCFHTFCVYNINDEFEILARSNDNVIEKIKHKNYKIYATNNHIERFKPFRKFDIDFLKDFFDI